MSDTSWGGLRVLVVYELVPEETRLFDVVMSQEDFSKFARLSGEFGNLSDNSEETENLVAEFSDKLELEWAKGLVELERASCISGNVDGVIVTGYIL